MSIFMACVSMFSYGSFPSAPSVSFLFMQENEVQGLGVDKLKQSELPRRKKRRLKKT